MAHNQERQINNILNREREKERERERGEKKLKRKTNKQ